jgi:glycosyltransferase involved in cell wall biosynthesis
MNVLLLSTFDTEGGAARAAYRLHQGLHSIGVASRMLVQTKQSSDPTVLSAKTNLAASLASARVTVDALPLKRYSKVGKLLFSPQWLPDSVKTKSAPLSADLFNLHWTQSGFVRIETLAQLQRPLVWSLHDMWAFTGGCHYTGDCERYQASCGACPQLQSQREQDLSRWVWQRKLNAWRSLDLTIVGLSAWMADCAKASSLLQHHRIEQIPNGLDTELYRPIDSATARQLLRLPTDKRLVLFGACHATSDKRKGFHFLQLALQQLNQLTWKDELELVVLGASRPEQPLDIGFKVHYLGTVQDELTQALIYSAADVFVLPSIQENLSNMILEALACGTPCVAFNIGGMPDMIEHQMNGYLAQPYEIQDLAQGIVWVIENESRYKALSNAARTKVVQEFNLQLQARRYAALYRELIEKSTKTN